MSWRHDGNKGSERRETALISGISESTQARGFVEPPSQLTGNIHHIGVQTTDLPNSIAWYQEFLGCTVAWEMNGGFSALSHRRLPGLSRLVEMVAGDVRLHLFTLDGAADKPHAADVNQFQHVCLRVETAEELRRWRQRWLALYESDRFVFARREPASEIDIDGQGMQSFYAFDVNGLEYEFTYMPDSVDGNA